MYSEFIDFFNSFSCRWSTEKFDDLIRRYVSYANNCESFTNDFNLLERNYKDLVKKIDKYVNLDSQSLKWTDKYNLNNYSDISSLVSLCDLWIDKYKNLKHTNEAKHFLDDDGRWKIYSLYDERLKKFKGNFIFLSEANELVDDYEKNGKLTEETYNKYVRFISHYKKLSKEARMFLPKKILVEIKNQKGLFDEITAFLRFRKDVDDFLNYMIQNKLSPSNDKIKRSIDFIKEFNIKWSRKPLLMIKSFKSNQLKKLEKIIKTGKGAIHKTVVDKIIFITSICLMTLTLLICLLFVGFSCYELIDSFMSRNDRFFAVVYGLLGGFFLGFTRIINLILFGGYWWDELWPEFIIDSRFEFIGLNLPTFINILFYIILVATIVLCIMRVRNHSSKILKFFNKYGLGFFFILFLVIAGLYLIYTCGVLCYDLAKSSSSSNVFLYILKVIVGILYTVIRLSSMIVLSGFWCKNMYSDHSFDYSPEYFTYLDMPKIVNILFLIVIIGLLIALLYEINFKYDDESSFVDFVPFVFYALALIAPLAIFVGVHRLCYANDGHFWDGFIRNAYLLIGGGFYSSDFYEIYKINGLWVEFMWILSLVECGGVVIYLKNN